MRGGEVCVGVCSDCCFEIFCVGFKVLDFFLFVFMCSVVIVSTNMVSYMMI